MEPKLKAEFIDFLVVLLHRRVLGLRSLTRR